GSITMVFPLKGSDHRVHTCSFSRFGNQISAIKSASPANHKPNFVNLLIMLAPYTAVCHIICDESFAYDYQECTAEPSTIKVTRLSFCPVYVYKILRIAPYIYVIGSISYLSG